MCQWKAVSNVSRGKGKPCIWSIAWVKTCLQIIMYLFTNQYMWQWTFWIPVDNDKLFCSSFIMKKLFPSHPFYWVELYWVEFYYIISVDSRRRYKIKKKKKLWGFFLFKNLTSIKLLFYWCKKCFWFQLVELKISHLQYSQYRYL